MANVENNLASNLRIIRKKKGITVKTISEKVFLQEHSYYSYERGHTEPSVPTLIRLSELLGVSIDALIKNDFKTSNQWQE